MSRSNIDDNIAHNEGSEDDAKVTTLGSTVVEGEKDCIFNHVDANNNVIVILEWKQKCYRSRQNNYLNWISLSLEMGLNSGTSDCLSYLFFCTKHICLWFLFLKLLVWNKKTIKECDFSSKYIDKIIMQNKISKKALYIIVSEVILKFSYFVA